jgi:EAL domain-containing protein (putative c-di-GMP-specific phosphodiesterase class I)
MRTGRIVAVEALLRWRHPERGELLPDEFIPVAESLGLIRAVDTWALQAVCEQIRHWNMAGLPPVRVAINASASTFGHRDFIDSVRRVLHSCQIEPGRLLFEITESSILHIGDATEQTIHALHELGASIAIDDFGTGFSSLAYLKLSGVNYLKIDRSFVKDIPYCVNDVAIIRAMLAIAKSLGICTIAEGIETEEQHEFLLDVGCQEGQGYYYARGMAPSDVEHMLQKRVRFQAAKLRAISHKQG